MVRELREGSSASYTERSTLSIPTPLLLLVTASTLMDSSCTGRRRAVGGLRRWRGAHLGHVRKAAQAQLYSLECVRVECQVPEEPAAQGPGRRQGQQGPVATDPSLTCLCNACASGVPHPAQAQRSPAEPRGSRKHQGRLRGVPHPRPHVEHEAGQVEHEGQVIAANKPAHSQPVRVITLSQQAWLV